jgi:hypothetical protein
MINDSSQSGSNTAPLRASSQLGLVDDAALREKELQLPDQEATAKVAIESRNLWFSSPLLLALASAIFGVIGTAVGAGLQGYSNFQLERQKFEFTLIQSALNTKDTKEAAKRLQFLVESGVIKSLDANKIKQLARDSDQLPIYPSGSASSGAVH